jgi:hypothetical protein
MSKSQDIENYINTIVGATVSTTALCTSCGCTLPTVLSYIRNNPSRFEKAGRGKYLIKAGIVNNNNNQSQDW